MRALLLDQGFGKIGTTGYLAGVDPKGVLVIHPRSEGVDVRGYDFMGRAIAQKDGYLSFFEPGNLIVWASSYKDEFKSLVQPDDLSEFVLSAKFGASGYAFLRDSKGNLIIHPSTPGENVYDSVEHLLSG